jgi:hypothetical protein
MSSFQASEVDEKCVNTVSSISYLGSECGGERKVVGREENTPADGAGILKEQDKFTDEVGTRLTFVSSWNNQKPACHTSTIV